jgi:hypothetical protein
MFDWLCSHDPERDASHDHATNMPGPASTLVWAGSQGIGMSADAAR